MTYRTSSFFQPGFNSSRNGTFGGAATCASRFSGREKIKIPATDTSETFTRVPQRARVNCLKGVPVRRAGVKAASAASPSDGSSALASPGSYLPLMTAADAAKVAHK